MNYYYFTVSTEKIYARTEYAAKEKLKKRLKDLEGIEIELDDIDTDVLPEDGSCPHCGEYH